MGLSFSCPFSANNDFEQNLESVIVKSIDLGEDGLKTSLRSISFSGKGAEATILQCLGSGRMVVEGSVRIRSNEAEMIDTIKAICEDKCLKSKDMVSFPSSVTENISDSPKHEEEAAIKLQKVYKSFRTRRKLADCAVLIEQSWWKLLDFAQLKHSSVSFFDLEKHESAISRWSRARTRAAKVGKGLSTNGKARKLALQHWLEAIDPRHRYGHNLHFYFVKWLHSQSKQPFFYWLDVGEGKEIYLEKCPRSKLQQQCIKYLGPMERKAYEVTVEDGKFFYKETGELLDTTGEPNCDKWIFVLSTSKNLYIGKKKKGTFQHSSFLAGGAALAAGRAVFEKGVLKAVWPHSGHYRPTPENFQDFISFLGENNVDLTDVKLDPVDEEGCAGKKDATHSRNNSFEDDSLTCEMLQMSESKSLHSFDKKLTNVEIPSNNDLFQRLNTPSDTDEATEELVISDDILGGEDDSETKEVIISGKCILQRINSHKGMKSYQLGKQLSCKWSTGAGPRIGCLRDYPSGLQSHALEQENLSPRSIHTRCLEFPSRPFTSTNLASEMSTPFSLTPGNLSHRSSRHFTLHSSPPCKETLTNSDPQTASHV